MSMGWPSDQQAGNGSGLGPAGRCQSWPRDRLSIIRLPRLPSCPAARRVAFLTVACWLPWACGRGEDSDRTPPPADSVEISTVDGRALAGRIVVEAQDGGILLEHEDGRYELLQLDQIEDRTSATAAEPAGARAFGQRILADLPAGFDLLVTKHYVVCFDTSRDYARWCAAVFERLHDAFGNYWRRAGLEVVDPHRPLVVIIFADRQAYEAHAARDLGAAADRVAGYYNLLSNRVTTYDLTGSDALGPDRGRRPGATAAAILASPAAAGLVSTLVHEATHQLAFNGGLHRRLAPVPVWVSEGIATFFETPDVTSPRGWRGVGEVNPPRLERFLAGHYPGLIEKIIRSDEGFRDPDEALDCYAAAWAVTHHLVRTRKRDFVAYLDLLAGKQPLETDSPEQRLREFREAFGEPAEIEQDAVRAAARLAARPRAR